MKPNTRYFTSPPICDNGDNGNAPCKFGKCRPVTPYFRWITIILLFLRPKPVTFFFFCSFPF